MLKQETKLCFRSVQDLWRFAQFIKVTNIEINTRELTLVCPCSELEIAVAIENFGAVLAE